MSDSRRALVTGGSGSIGSAICRRLISNGYDVCFTTRGKGSEADALVALGAHAYIYDALKNSREDLPALAFDSLVLAAGVNQTSARVADVQPKDWRETFRVNVDFAWDVCSRYIPGMLENGFGRIVAVGSIYSIRGSLLNSPYNSSKHALSGLMKSITKDYADRNVCASEVLPGAVSSRMMDMLAVRKAAEFGIEPAEYLGQVASSMPSKVLVQPDEIARAIGLLLDGDNSLAGVQLVLDGGLTC